MLPDDFPTIYAALTRGDRWLVDHNKAFVRSAAEHAKTEMYTIDVTALLRVARAAREYEAAQIDADRAERDPRGHWVLNEVYTREHVARARLWDALAALDGREPPQ